MLSAMISLCLLSVHARAGRAGARDAQRSPAARSAGCDRLCLLQFLTDYTEALVDNDVYRLALASGVRVTSNGTVAAPGKGEVWGPARRLPYRQAFVDPTTGAAVFYGVVTNAINASRADARSDTSGAPVKWWFYVVRLKVQGRQIAEVEEISYERPAGGFGADASALHLPDRVFDPVLPQAER